MFNVNCEPTRKPLRRPPHDLTAAYIRLYVSGEPAKGLCVLTFRGAGVVAEISQSKRCRLKNLDAVLLALPRLAPGRQVRQEFGVINGNGRADVIFALLLGSKRLVYVMLGNERYGNCLCSGKLRNPVHNLLGLLRFRLLEQKDVGLVCIKKPQYLIFYWDLYRIHPTTKTSHAPIKQLAGTIEGHKPETLRID